MKTAPRLLFAALVGCSEPVNNGPLDGSPVTDAVVTPPVDAGPPRPPVCAAVAGGGTTTVAAPTLVRSLHGLGDEGWLGSPAVVDLDGDHTNEIVVARGPRVVVYAADGSLRWNAFVHGNDRIWAAPVIADFVGGPALEIAAAAGSRVTLFDARGAPLAPFPVTWRDELRALAAGDLDGDGRAEIVTASTVPLAGSPARDLLMAWHGDGSVVAGFPPNASGASGCDDNCDVTGGFDQTLAVGPIDDDARLDVLAPMDDAYMSWHHGSGEAFRSASLFRRGSRVPAVRFLHDYAEAQQGYSETEDTSLQAHFTNSAPTIVDLDGDRVRELVVVASVQNAAQSEREHGVALWVVRADGSRPPAWVTPFVAPDYLAGLNDLGDNIVALTNQATAVDLDAAWPGLEVLFAGFDGRIHCVGSERTERWTYAYTTADDVLTGGLVAADLSGDGRPEVAFATYSTRADQGALYVLDCRGALLSRTALPGRGAMAVPTVADVDGDGTLEVVVSLKDATDAGAEVLVFNVAGSATNCLPWPTGRANLRRSGLPGA